MNGLKVAILGAAGAVGQEVLRLLDERKFRVASLKLLATARSAGTAFEFRGEKLVVEEVRPDSFAGVDVAFFAATTGASKEFAPLAVRRGAVVVDKSNAFRMDPEVPLAVPEVNPDAIAAHRGIVASPNCSTIQMVVALKPIHDAARLTRVVVSTYQSVSGTGREAMDELRHQSGELLAGREARPEVYPYQIGFNLLPHIDAFEPNGYTGEEMKMVRESRKILDLPDLPITATTVRVPVFISHSESILAETEEKLTVEKAREVLSRFPGVVVWDDPAKLHYPTPVQAAGRDEIFVGRIREDLSSPRGLNLWVVSDNLRKGAATNAIQIAEFLVARGLL